MARVELASYLKAVDGRIGNFVYYSAYGREYLRVYVKPENPDTVAQKTVRKTFGNAVRSWQSLSGEEKQKHNKKAYRLNLSGYNLYISLFMKDNLPKNDIKSENRTLYINSMKHSDRIHIADCSVASPLPWDYRSLTCYIHTVNDSAAG